jgi:hypothetical protein
MMYDAGMKVVLISAGGEIPAGLRAIVERGSTAVVEHPAHELSGSRAPDADRIVFWGAGDELQRLIEQYAGDARSDAAGRILVVRPDRDAHQQPAVAFDQLFTWPRDEDRLKVVFLTGA